MNNKDKLIIISMLTIVLLGSIVLVSYISGSNNAFNGTYVTKCKFTGEIEYFNNTTLIVCGLPSPIHFKDINMYHPLHPNFNVIASNLVINITNNTK